MENKLFSKKSFFATFWFKNFQKWILSFWAYFVELELFFNILYDAYSFRKVLNWITLWKLPILIYFLNSVNLNTKKQWNKLQVKYS